MDNNIETSRETWQVETGGQVFDTTLDEMSDWIGDGSLLRIDRVRKGNLRWIEAGKVPQLIEFFNAKDAADPVLPVITTTKVEKLGVPEAAPFENCEGSGVNKGGDETVNVAIPPTVAPPRKDVCAMHPEMEAAFACDTCDNLFCRACPTGYGSTVKICPFCGAMCRSLAQAAVAARSFEATRRAAADDSFGFSDFGSALVYPFKFKLSLFAGAIMFAIFSLGQSAGGMGSIFMMGSALICFLMANMLTFGVLANTVENFTQGKLDTNFMPSFDDFSIWDDVVHPFFLSIGVYITSFGPLLVVVLVAVFMIVGAAKSEITGMQEDAARAVNPQLQYAAKAANQTNQVRELVKNVQSNQQKRIEQIEKGEIETGEMPNLGGMSEPSEEDFQRLNQMIQDTRKAQLEGAIGKTSETKAEEQEAFLKKLFGYGLVFLLIGGVCLLWGLFYFPAACAVAGYTQSFAATLNPTVGLDTIRRLGGTYVLILLFGLILLIASSVVSGIFNIAFLAFDLPGMGNLPAKFLGSMFGFYISVVFSCLLGYALFKKADLLDLLA